MLLALEEVFIHRVAALGICLRFRTSAICVGYNELITKEILLCFIGRVCIQVFDNTNSVLIRHLLVLRTVYEGLNLLVSCLPFHDTEFFVLSRVHLVSCLVVFEELLRFRGKNIRQAQFCA